MAQTKTNGARINYFVDLIIAVGFLLTAASGLVLFFAGPSGGYQGGRNPRYLQEVAFLSRWTWKTLHDWGGIAMVAGVLAHLVLHWKWILCMTRNLLQGRPPAGRRAAQPDANACPVEG